MEGVIEVLSMQVAPLWDEQGQGSGKTTTGPNPEQENGLNFFCRLPALGAPEFATSDSDPLQEGKGPQNSHQSAGFLV